MPGVVRGVEEARNGTAEKTKPPLVGGGFEEKVPGSDLLLHADAHYHRRGCVSLPSSGWDRVGPQRYSRQGRGSDQRGGRRILKG